MGRRLTSSRRSSLILGFALTLAVFVALFALFKPTQETPASSGLTVAVRPTDTPRSAPTNRAGPTEAAGAAARAPLWQLAGTTAPPFVPGVIAEADGQTVKLHRALHALQVGETVEVHLSARPSTPLWLTLEKRSTRLGSTVLQGRFAGPVGYRALFTDNGTSVQATLETPSGMLEGVGQGPLLWLYKPKSLEGGVDPNDTLRPQASGRRGGA